MIGAVGYMQVHTHTYYILIIDYFLCKNEPTITHKICCSNLFWFLLVLFSSLAKRTATNHVFYIWFGQYNTESFDQEETHVGILFHLLGINKNILIKYVYTFSRIFDGFLIQKITKISFAAHRKKNSRRIADKQIR